MRIEIDKIREYISFILKRRGDEQPFTDDDPLVTSGRLDSMDIMEVAFFLEENFGLDFKDSGIDSNNLNSINLIYQLMSNPASENKQSRDKTTVNRESS